MKAVRDSRNTSGIEIATCRGAGWPADFAEVAHRWSKLCITAVLYFYDLKEYTGESS